MDTGLYRGHWTVIWTVRSTGYSGVGNYAGQCADITDVLMFDLKCYSGK